MAIETVFEGMACQDCGMIIANADDSGISDPDTHYGHIDNHDLLSMMRDHKGDVFIESDENGDSPQSQNFWCDYCGQQTGGYYFTLVVLGDPADII